MQINIPTEALDIIHTIEKAGFEAYIVGGAVRDTLIGRPTYDWDFTTNAPPEAIVELFDNSYYNNSYGMVGIPSKDEDNRPYEVTTFRTEHGYSDSRRPDSVSWGSSIKEDVERRDFTINALALKLESVVSERDERELIACEFKLIDFFSGEEDLKNKIIRAVGDANERFSEDALRMMRAVRIAGELNYTIDEETKQALSKNAQLISNIAVERVKDELLKLLASPHAYKGIELMHDVGLLQELLPELEATIGVDQKSPNRHHLHDVWTHSLLSLKFCPSNDPIVRFATLLHDIGKPSVRAVLSTGIVTFYNHEVVGGKIVKNIAKRLRFSNKQADKLYKLVRYHQFTVDEHQTDSAIKRFIRRVSKEYLTDMLDLRVADRLGGGANETSWRFEEFKLRLHEVQQQPFAIKDLKIDGNDVMEIFGISPSPQIGEILKSVFESVETKKLENKREVLLEELQRLQTLTP